MTMRTGRPASADVRSLHLLPENASCSLDCHGLFYKDTTLSDTVHDAQDRHDTYSDTLINPIAGGVL